MEQCLLNQKVAECLMLDNLYEGLDKYIGKNIMCSVIEGFSGIVFLDNFTYAVAEDSCGERYLSLEDGNTDVNYTVGLKEIDEVNIDLFINQTLIELKNGQTIDIWDDNLEDYAEHEEN